MVKFQGMAKAVLTRDEGGLYLEIIITLLSGILGVSSSIVYEVVSIILKRKRESKEDNITFLAEMMEKYGLEVYAKRFLERFLEEA